MLPLELLKVIAGALPRDDLDALMLVNDTFRDLAARDFVRDPLRHFEPFDVRHHWIGKCKYEFVFFLTDGTRRVCHNPTEFLQRMRLARVGKLSLGRSLRIDDALIDVLLPHKEAWRNGTVEVQSAISTVNPSLYERAFSELLLCKCLDLLVRGNDRLSRPFMTLPVVRERRSVRIRGSSLRLAVNEILEWLRADVSPTEPSTLTLCDDGLVVGGIATLLDALKTEFAESATAHSYHVVPCVTPFYGSYECSGVNRATFEALNIRRDPAYAVKWRVDAERKLKKD